MKVVNLDQRSSDWLTWRNTGIGSSDAAAIVGLSPWSDAGKVWMQKRLALQGHQTPGKKDNGAMARGRRLEPVAVALYENLMGWKVPAVCGVHEEHDWLKVSLDGWNGAKDLFIEVKAPNRDDHALALKGEVPEKYVVQMMHQYLVSGARAAHYVSYSDYFPTAQQLAVVPVRRDDEMIQSLFEAERKFWMDHVLTGEPPA